MELLYSSHSFEVKTDSITRDKAVLISIIIVYNFTLPIRLKVPAQHPVICLTCLTYLLVVYRQESTSIFLYVQSIM